MKSMECPFGCKDDGGNPVIVKVGEECPGCGVIIPYGSGTAFNTRPIIRKHTHTLDHKVHPKP
jgi:hypothetical protein